MHDLTTQQLIEKVSKDTTLTERELVLLDRLCAAIEEIDLLVEELRDARAQEPEAEAAS